MGKLCIVHPGFKKCEDINIFAVSIHFIIRKGRVVLNISTVKYVMISVQPVWTVDQDSNTSTLTEKYRLITVDCPSIILKPKLDDINVSII